MDTPKFPNTSYIILGMLTGREMSGYELMLMLARSLKHFYWTPAKSQIYAELRRLEAYDLLVAHDVVQEQRPDKRVYRLTRRGHDAVQQWLTASQVEPDRYKSSYMAKLFFGHMLPRERLFALLDSRRRQLTEDITAAEEKQQDLRSRSEHEADFLFPLLTLELKLACFYAEREWTSKTLQRLQALPPDDAE